MRQQCIFWSNFVAYDVVIPPRLELVRKEQGDKAMQGADRPGVSMCILLSLGTGPNCLLDGKDHLLPRLVGNSRYLTFLRKLSETSNSGPF